MWHAGGRPENTENDPSLLFLLRNVRSKLVRRLFFQKPQDAYTEAHNVQILVRSYFMHPCRSTHADADVHGTWILHLRHRPGEAGAQEWPEL